MMNEIKCDVCNKTIAYTNRKISKVQNNFLYSKKLSNNQIYAMMINRKLIYCPVCYQEGITKAKEEREREREEMLRRLRIK